jgi:hypothetical protein
LGSATGNGRAAVKDRWKKVEHGTRGVKREAPGPTLVNSRQHRQASTCDATRLTVDAPDPAQTVNPKGVFCVVRPARGERLKGFSVGRRVSTGANAARRAPIE